jgi:lysophospholipase L1-like esterase
MRSIRLIAVIGAVAAVVALTGPAAPAGASGPVLPPPASMAATGDSFTRTFATGSASCDGLGNCSWSTGTVVNSHYQRLRALNPALTGNATNAAQLGAQMSGFVTQVNAIAPSHPDYVTVLLGGGDICLSSTTPAQFKTQFRAGMDALFGTSPSSHVLVASIWNFESLRSAVLAGNPSATWGSLCGVFFNASPSDRALIMDRVAQYNAVLETECATYANCLFDGYALFNHVWSPAEVSTVDNFHPSITGQEMMSQVLYDAGYTWAITPANKDACKNNGWKSVVTSQGQSFQNQGDCVRYVTTSETIPTGA